MNLILDTSAYSELKRSEPNIVRLVRSADTLYLPIVVIAELLYGFRGVNKFSSNQKDLERFLSSEFVEILHIDKLQTAETYSQLKMICKSSGKVLSEHDLWIAALASEHSYTLATYDKDFSALEASLGDKIVILNNYDKI